MEHKKLHADDNARADAYRAKKVTSVRVSFWLSTVAFKQLAKQAEALNCSLAEAASQSTEAGGITS